MKIAIEKFHGNPLAFMRSAGYTFMERTPDDEWNFARPLAGAAYPRFHCYLRQKGGSLNINLHLDQKRPSYEGTAAHGGEYDGELVTAEAERLRRTAAKNR